VAEGGNEDIPNSDGWWSLNADRQVPQFQNALAQVPRNALAAWPPAVARPVARLGLVPDGQSTLRELFLAMFRSVWRLEQTPDPDGARRGINAYICGHLHRGELIVRVTGGPNHVLFRLPSYCWTECWLELTDDNPVTIDAFNRIVRTDILSGIEFGAYEGRTPLVAQADAEAFTRKWEAWLKEEDSSAQEETLPVPLSIPPIGPNEAVKNWMERAEVHQLAREGAARAAGREPNAQDMGHEYVRLLHLLGRKNDKPESLAAMYRDLVKRKRVCPA
jgi:hypothetical protein